MFYDSIGLPGYMLKPVVLYNLNFENSRYVEKNVYDLKILVFRWMSEFKCSCIVAFWLLAF